MKRLTRKQVLFLIKNEDKLTLEELAHRFRCTCKDVYETYDRITDTAEYKRYVREKIDKMFKRRSGKDEILESIKQDRRNREKIEGELLRRNNSNNTNNSIAYDAISTHVSSWRTPNNYNSFGAIGDLPGSIQTNEVDGKQSL